MRAITVVMVSMCVLGAAAACSPARADEDDHDGG